MTSPVCDQQPSAIDRRRLVRTGAVLAWTVPAISVAAAAPAFAVSGCCHLTLSGTAHWRAGELNYVDVPLTIANGCAGSVGGLTVILTVCGLEDVTYAGAEYLPAGWTQLGKGNKPLDPDPSGCFTLTFLTVQPLAGTSTTYPRLMVKSMAYAGTGNHRPAATITATVSTTGCTSLTAAIGVPQVG